VLTCAALFGQPVAADNLDFQARALKIIREAAADICTTVKQEGDTQTVDLSGNVKAKLGGAVAKIAELGVEGAGKYKSEQYKNVLQKDLAEIIRRNTDCRLEVFRLLQEKMITSSNRDTQREELERRGQDRTGVNVVQPPRTLPPPRDTSSNAPTWPRPDPNPPTILCPGGMRVPQGTDCSGPFTSGWPRPDPNPPTILCPGGMRVPQGTSC
jgi:hypothetical protein